MNDRLLQDRSVTETDRLSQPPSTSAESLETVKKKIPRKSLNVSGPIQPYHPRLKNFWYPVAFTSDLKDDTMVSQLTLTRASKSDCGATKFSIATYNEEVHCSPLLKRIKTLRLNNGFHYLLT